MFPDIQLYVVLALAATLASVVATHLRSFDGDGGKRKAFWLALGTCLLLGAAWVHLLAALACLAFDAWQLKKVIAWDLVVHLLVIAAMLPIVCATVIQSWISGATEVARVESSANPSSQSR